MEELTPKEINVFNYIKQSLETNGYSPSMRDVKDAVGVSVSTAHGYVEKLVAKGWISQMEGKSRTLRIGRADSPYCTKHVPLLGRVRAGLPILAYENYEDFVHLPVKTEYSTAELFALKVQGESMIEAGILDGDIVLVHHVSVANDGDIVIALIEDEATVKTFYHEEDHFRLQPENSSMAPIIVNEVEILGKVISCHRYY